MSFFGDQRDVYSWVKLILEKWLISVEIRMVVFGIGFFPNKPGLTLFS